MDTLKFDDLDQGGFAGLIERRFVMDKRVFGRAQNPGVFNGLGNFVYLADANFLPKGETGMHGHKEIDVISVMVDGRISHAGSLEHGQSLHSGAAQVQRAGAQGFEHNEINPDHSQNNMIQLWVMPDERGEDAGYKLYEPKQGEVTHIYGGPKDQDDTFYSATSISVANANTGQAVTQEGEVMAYLTRGKGAINDQAIDARTLVHSNKGIEFVAEQESQLILVYMTR